ncbi:MAG: methyltransferase domain-containing protein [Candidatus Pacearchaeota archaeon]
MKKIILNVGCGKDTYGTDFVDLYPQRKEVKKCNVDEEKLPYKKNTFDKVYSKCMFEHLKNPGFVLKEMARGCKKNGKVEIITDNASYWYYALDNKTPTGKYESTLEFGEEDKHYSLFTDWHLTNHFKDAGLTTIKIKYIDNTGSPTSFKGKMVQTINKILRKISPIKRLAYGRIRIVGEKE